MSQKISNPILTGFNPDPSLFHDEDGKKWFVNMIWDHRDQKVNFGGILLQEYDHSQQKLVGCLRTCVEGSLIMAVRY